MTIAIAQFEAVGARIYLPEGPFGAAGQTPFPSFKVGTVAAGDDEAEFVYVPHVRSGCLRHPEPGRRARLG
jgi:hypothetical protein